MHAICSASRATESPKGRLNMEKQIIGRGMLAGVAGAVSAFVFARIFLEPVIERAIAYVRRWEQNQAEMRAAD